MQGSDHVDEVIKAQDMTGLAARFNDIKEAKYASNLREPLFKGFERKYAWPEQIENKENYPFGLPTVSSEKAKELVNPDDRVIGENPAEIIEIYKKTHGNFAPGE
jgi:hypothetical protein